MQFVLFFFFGDRIHLEYEVWTFIIIIESISSYICSWITGWRQEPNPIICMHYHLSIRWHGDGPGAVLDFKLQLPYVINNFYYYFYIRFIVRRGGASCWTLHIVYATPLAPMLVSPLPPRPSSASAQGTPLVIAPHANPAQKRCFRTCLSRIVRRCSTVFLVVVRVLEIDSMFFSCTRSHLRKAQVVVGMSWEGFLLVVPVWYSSLDLASLTNNYIIISFSLVFNSLWGT